jgi:hypothetical protein
MITTRLSEAERMQLADLLELGGSPEAVLSMERHLTLLFGRRPTLWEIVRELSESQRTGFVPVVEPSIDGAFGELLESAGSPF